MIIFLINWVINMDNKNGEKDKRVELLNYYADQWKYRNTHYWSLVIKDIYVCVIIILFPYLTNAINIAPSTNLDNNFFSHFGIIVSVIFTYLLLCENSRIVETRKVILKLIADIGEKKYMPKRVHPAFRTPLAKVIPFAILIFHICLAKFY